MVKVIKNKSLPYEFQQIANQLIWKGQKNRLTVCEFSLQKIILKYSRVLLMQINFIIPHILEPRRPTDLMWIQHIYQACLSLSLNVPICSMRG